MSEGSVVKAGGEKGSEACRCTSRTFFADNADPRDLQPFAVNRDLGVASLAGSEKRDQERVIEKAKGYLEDYQERAAS